MKYSLTALCPSDYRYPELLNTVPSPPKKIYIKGNFEPTIFENTLGIVGTRRMSSYGKQVIDAIFRALNVDTITIVSGFMYGVDVYAHKKAIEYKMPTIGVLPCGVDVIHPLEQVKIYDEMLASGGIVLSEFEPSAKPRIWAFPKRNRIIAGLSKVLVVIEAGLQSGSIITANFAHKFGREVYAVPGSVFSSTSAGCNLLIKDYAIPLVNARQLGHYYDKRTELTGDVATKILTYLKTGARSTNDLAMYLNVPATEVNKLLSQLLLCDAIKEQGGRYCVTHN